MRLLIKNKNAISQVMGYLLSLILTALVITGSLYTTQMYIDQNFRSAALIYAEELANKVVDLLTNSYIVTQQYPQSSYETSINIPTLLAGKYDYYIELQNDKVYVKTTDGQLTVSKNFYDISDKMFSNFEGKVYGSGGNLRVVYEPTELIYKLDFGDEDSTCVPGYFKVSGRKWGDYSTDWDLNDPGVPTAYDLDVWNYRTIIRIKNPTGNNIDLSAIGGYEMLVTLNDTNFNHDYLHSSNVGNGEDIRFFIEDGGTYEECAYWIERWYPASTHTTRIWVRIDAVIPQDPDSLDLFMYYGYDDAAALPSNGIDNDGEDAFLFFDDFSSSSIDLAKWAEYKSASDDIYIYNGLAILKNNAALISTTDDSSWNSRYVIESKAKSYSSSAPYEASIFARMPVGSPAGSAPYKVGSVFSSGYFTAGYGSFNTGIIAWEDSHYVNLSSDPDNSSMDKSKFYRLRYIVDDQSGTGGSDHDVVVRYFYDSFLVEGSAAVNYSGVGTSGYFGPCVVDPTDTTNEIKAYYDWIYVRSYVAKDYVAGDTLQDVEPTAYVLDTQSSYFYWSEGGGDNNNIEARSTYGTELGADFVCNVNGVSDDGKFILGGVEAGERYTVIVTLGDKNGSLVSGDLAQDMQLKLLTRDGTVNSEVFDFTQDSPYTQYSFNGESIIPYNADIYFKLTLTDTTTADATFHWALCGVTVEKGERVISIDGGQ